MKGSRFTMLLMASVLAAAPFLANAAELTGRIVGHSCAHKGELCPVDKLDPHITLEPDFVLVKPDGEYYFLTNLPRDTKVRYVLETATVKGSVNPKHNAVAVSELNVNNKTVWSKSAQEAIDPFFISY